MDIKMIMKSLSKRRPIFHLESDFQFALAWEIQTHYPASDIRLEVPVKHEKSARIDVKVRLDGAVYLIELKYLKKSMSYEIDGEQYILAEGVHDMDMYGCIADIGRLEKFKKKYDDVDAGYAIWLTNDSAYWDKNYNASYYQEFHAPDDSVKTGEMYFADINLRTNKPPQILRQRGYENPITLDGCYKIKWDIYSNLGERVPNGIFKYSMVSV